jgi:hypothetical protein
VYDNIPDDAWAADQIEPVPIPIPSTSSSTSPIDTPNLNDTVTAPQDDNQRQRRPPKAPGKKKTADEEPGSSDKAGPSQPTRRSNRRGGY